VDLEDITNVGSPNHRDDAEAKAKVTELLQSFGWTDIIDLGDITMVEAVWCAPEARLQLQDRPLTRDQLACAVICSTSDGYVGVLVVYRMASPVTSHLLLFAFHLQNAGFRSGAEGTRTPGLRRAEPGHHHRGRSPSFKNPCK
jgi:hypothetical protein